MECSDLSRWDFFIERFAWQTKKNWAFSVLVAAISAALQESFVPSKYTYSDFVRQLKVVELFFPSFCACEMPPG